jgi:hypothetical protein
MKKITPRRASPKLTLQREVLRVLGDVELGRVAGGGAMQRNGDSGDATCVAVDVAVAVEK